MWTYGFRPSRVHRLLNLGHYGISVQALGRYCRQLSAAGSLQAERLEHRASRPHAEDAATTQRLTGHPLAGTVAVSVPHHSVLSTQDSALNTAVPQHSELRTLYSGLSRRFLDRLARAIDDPELTPDELTRLANCFARQSHAFERSQAQRIANARYAYERNRRRKQDKPPAKMTLRERARQVYGIDMPALEPFEVTVDPGDYTPEEEAALRARGAIK